MNGRSIITACMWLLVVVPVNVGVSPRFTIATYNINWGNPNLENVAKSIHDSKATIVCLQETNQRSEAFLKRRFVGEYPHMRFVGHQNRFLAERFGYLSKLPLKKLSFAPPVHGLFGTCFATVTKGDRDIRIANVHLSPFVVRRGSSMSQALAAISKTETTHKKEIAEILKNIDPTKPTLVVGDFNSLSTFIAPLDVSKRGLIDSFASVTERPDSQPTWRWALRTGHIQFRIDYIFHSSHFTTLISRIIRSRGSDHYLVVSQLQMDPTD